MKYQQKQSDNINICIACNQGCLDNVFKGKRATCLVNPQAGYELEYAIEKAPKSKAVLVVGAGPAGMACACYLAERGHKVTLIEKSSGMGGQFNLAMRVPGKEDFNYTLTYFKSELARLKVNIELKTAFDPDMKSKYDDIVFSTGVSPRLANIECSDDKRILAYDEVIRGEVEVGKRVAILGAGGIGFDMVAFLAEPANKSIDEFQSQWGIETEQSNHQEQDKLYMLKRSPGRFGSELGKTTGWIHRQVAKQQKVEQISDCSYVSFSNKGLEIKENEITRFLDVDTVIACIGQVSNTKNYDAEKENSNVHVIGGAKLAQAIDAKRAIFEALEVARRI